LDHHHVVVLGGFVHIEAAVMMKILPDLHILVLGLGDSGLAMVRWCESQGAKVTVVDTREHPPGLDSLRAEGLSATFIHGDFHARYWKIKPYKAYSKAQD